MLNFERFRVTNAGYFKNFDLNLRKRGLVRMLGRNGVGKSTVWHLFTQNHYGVSPNAAKKSDLMFNDTESDFLIESTFEKSGQIYTAAQAVKSKTKSPKGKAYGSGVYLFRDGEDISMHRDPDTLKLIKQTMGWTLEEWYGYVYLAQSTTHTLINGTRSERQTYLSALFNLLPLDTLHSYCKDKAESYKETLALLEQEKQEYAIKVGLLQNRSIEQLEQQVVEMNEGIAFIDKQLETMRTKQTSFNRKKTLGEKFAQKVAPAESVEDLQAAVEHYQKQEAAFKAGVERKAKLEAELKQLFVVQEVVVPEDYTSVIESPDQNLSQLQQDIQDRTNLSRKSFTLVAPEVPADYDETMAGPDLDEFTTLQRIKKLRMRPEPPTVERPDAEKVKKQEEKVYNFFVEIGTLGQRLKQLEFNQSVCNQCGTSLPCDDRATEKAEKQEEYDALNVAYTKAKKLLEQMKTDLKTWADHDALGPDESAEIPVLEASVEQYRKKKRYLRIQQDQENFKAQEAERQKVSDLPQLQAALDLYSQKIQYRTIAGKQEARARYVEKKERIEQDLKEVVLGVSVAGELQNAQTQLDQAKEIRQITEELLTLKDAKDVSLKIQAIENEKQELQQSLGQRQREKQEITQLSDSIVKLEQAITGKLHLSSIQTKYGLLAKGYGKAGQLRERQLARFSRYLEEALLSHTIRQLPEHRFIITVDDGIDIQAVKNGGKPYDVKFMSGGEKGSLSVAFLFALDDLLPPDRRTNLKIVDEIESHFDKERQQDFIQHTLPELKKRAETVIVISHSAAANSGSFDSFWKIADGKITETNPEQREYEEEEAAHG